MANSSASKLHQHVVVAPTPGETKITYFEGSDNTFKPLGLSNPFNIESGSLISTGIIDRVSKTANHTLELSDRGKLVEMNLSTDGTLTVPADEDVDFPVGTTILVSAYGEGVVTIVPDDDVTIITAATSLVVSGQYTIATLTKRASDEWYAAGALGGKGIATLISSSTPGINVDAYEMLTITALGAAATFAAPTGTPVEGQKILFRIEDDGVARALSFDSAYRAGTDVSFPTTTVAGKVLYLGFVWNATDSKWDLIAKAGGF